jgi:hypothetical protein
VAQVAVAVDGIPHQQVVLVIHQALLQVKVITVEQLRLLELLVVVEQEQWEVMEQQIMEVLAALVLPHLLLALQ